MENLNDEEKFILTYEYNNKYFNVEATEEMHNRFKNDAKYFEEQVGENLNTNDVNETVERNESVGNFKWAKPATLLLVSLYKEKVEDFRNPKVKKRTIWTWIKEEFLRKGYVITEDDLDRKWRNMKKTYTGIVDNQTATGRGRIYWDYFEAFQEIYQTDKAVHLPNTLSSTPTQLKVNFAPNQCYQKVKENSISVAPSKAMPEHTTPTSTQSASCSEKILKRTRNKSLYDVRKKLVDIENKRVDELKLIREAIVQNNKLQADYNAIQKERNDLLKSYLQK